MYIWHISSRFFFISYKVQIAGMPNINITYHGVVFDPNLIKAAIQHRVDHKIPPNLYALILTMEDDIATRAIFGICRKRISKLR